MTLVKRSITTILGLPVVLWLIYVGDLPLLFACGIAALVGLREFYLAFSKKDRLIHIIGYLATVGYFVAIFVFGAGYWLLIALTLFIITVQTCLVVFFRKLPMSECISTVYGFLYVPFLLSFVVLVREHPLGYYYVWLIFTACFGCDTFAYFTGSLFGKRKLKNTPSPSKSLEGLIGGVVGATLIGLLYGLAVSHFSAYPENVEYIVLISGVISFLGALFSIIGDLAASAVKRHCEIKDFGNVFPGHGGVMDRLDSILTVAPIVYMVMNVMIWLMI
ncbi:MAG: phosphatidate cytidylyltransferase [Defluviitaleaceae bacterium]|nr:phosphatidate cytidylyltransferase [Defluviitaleaceae bacterium]MCL2264044.1 phosphatidate cytidylyltransferase [Defluviitaleaceae bacterium]